MEEKEKEPLSTPPNTTNTENSQEQTDSFELEDYPLTLEELREQQAKLQRKVEAIHKKEEKLTEKGKNHLARLHTKKVVSIEDIIKKAKKRTFRPQKKVRQFMGYSDARQIVWEICKNRSAVLGKEFIVDDYNKPIIQNLIRYFIGSPHCTLDLQKGLFLWGDVGLGKTYLINVLKTFCDASNHEYRKFRLISTHQVYSKIQSTGKINSLNAYNTGDICFDDLGNEPPVYKLFGNDISVMEQVLTKRYENFVNGKCITHATSNHTPEDIANVYGTRIADRCKEMFNFIFFDGKSRRS